MMTQCIGSMGGGEGSMFAELDFDHNEATVLKRGKTGRHIGPLATVPLGQFEEETEELDAKLDPDDEQNKFLMSIVGLPRLIAALRFTERKLRPRDEDDEYYEADPARCNEDHAILREVEEALEWATTVPS